MSKKIVSLALAIIMVVAMLPTSLLSASAEGEAIQYRYAFGMNAGESGLLTKTRVLDVTYAGTNNMWEFQSAYQQTGIFYTATNGSAVRPGQMYLKDDSANGWCAIKIKVPVSGKYDIEYIYQQAKTTGAIGDVYLLPAGTVVPGGYANTFAKLSTIVATGTKIAEDVDYTSTSSGFANAPAPIICRGVSVNAGENVLLFHPTGKGANYTGTKYMDQFPASVTLTPHVATTYSKTVHTLRDTEVLDSEIPFTVKAVMTDGETFKPTAAGDGITVETASGESVQVLSGAMSEGVYSATLKTLSLGETQLKLTATVDGTAHESFYTVNVIERPPLADIVVETTQDTMKFKDKTAPSEAWTTNGFELVLDYPKMATEISRYTPRIVKDEQGYQKLLVELRTGSDVWPAQENAMFTIRKRVYNSGYYAIDMKAATLSTASDYSIYVNGEYTGDFVFKNPDSTDAGGVILREKTLNTVFLPEGYAEISFRARRKNGSGVVFFTPYSITFKPLANQDGLEIREVENDAPAKIAINESSEVTARVVMNDGSYRCFGPDDDGGNDTENTIVGVVSENPSTVEVSEFSSMQFNESEKISFKLTAKAVADTNVKITVKVDGKEYTETIPISVMAKPTLDTAELSFEKSPLPATRSTKPVLALTRTGDGKAYTYDYAATYESLDTSIATVDADTGVVTGIKPGRTTIRATITDWDNNTLSDETEIEIISKPTLTSIIVEDPGVLVVGHPTQIPVIAVMSDGDDGDIKAYAPAYESSDTSVATVSADGIVTPLAEGTTIFSVTARNESGKMLAQVFKISVSATALDFEIDFTKTETDNTDRSILYATPGYTVLRDEGASNHFRRVSLVDIGETCLQIATPGTSGMWPASTNKNTTFAFSVDIPMTDDYGIDVYGGLWSAGAIYSMYVDDVYAGDHSFYDPDAIQVSDEVDHLNTLHLTAGTHKIYFRIRESYMAYLYLRKIVFSPREGSVGVEKIEASVPTRLAIGEKASGIARVLMEDGTLRRFGPAADGTAVDENNKLIATASNDGAVVSGLEYKIDETGEREYTITAVKAGQTSVTFTAVIGGVAHELPFNIEIEDDPIAETGVETEAKELFAGDMTKLMAASILRSGRKLGESTAQTTFESLDTDVAEIINGNILKTKKEGTVSVKATTTFNDVTVHGVTEIVVQNEGLASMEISAGGSERIRLTDKENDTVPLYLTACDNLGKELPTDNMVMTSSALTPEFATVNSRNNVTAVAEGDAKFSVTVNLDGRIREIEVTIPVVRGKSEATYLTEDKTRVLRENYKKYSWVKSAGDAYIKEADIFVDRIDQLYDMIHSEGVPRAICIGDYVEPLAYTCRYCNTDLMKKYGQFSWIHNAFTHPWKIQCPECQRFFPTNDFGSFYKLGLNEYGEFDRQRALDKHAELFGDDTAEVGSDEWYGYGNPDGYLYNELYPEVDGVSTLNGGQGLRPGEKKETWGVDDSLGYVPKDENGKPYYSIPAKNVIERHTYIGEYAHFAIWSDYSGGNDAVIKRAIANCSKAYYYTGIVKYGRCAAILLDRLADFYPDYDISLYAKTMANTDGSIDVGKTIGCIWEAGSELPARIEAYDIVFDLYDDPVVINYLKNKSEKIKMRHAKNTASQIRTNIEDGLLRIALEGLIDCSVSGNFGYGQKVNALAAVVLDSMPESGKWIDYLFAPNWTRLPPCVGGGVDEALVDTVDADGQGNEGSRYNVDWFRTLLSVQNILDGYSDRYAAANLYNNPKFVQMFYANIPLMLSYYTPQIGDSGATGSTEQWMSKDVATTGWEKFNDPIFAQVLYKLNGNTAKGLRYDATKENPESLEDEVNEVIKNYGQLKLDSNMMTNFGFAALRDGDDYSDTTATTAINTSRDMWMYFGSTIGHAHRDSLNLGMTAFGLNFMPDLGYPAVTSVNPDRMQWLNTTLSHNTVMVDEKPQTREGEIRGKAQHFDDDGMVKLMDVKAEYVYDGLDEYRRSVLMIGVDDENSYAVDFFRVLGGKNHLYSFHAASDEVSSTEGLDFTLIEDEDGNYISGSQLDDNGNYKGTYVGRDTVYTYKDAATGETKKIPVEYGPDPSGKAESPYYPYGYTYIKNVDRDTTPENTVEIDFAIKDFRKILKDSRNLGLHMTILNSSNVENGAKSEISITDGLPPQKAANKQIEKLKYVLVKNTGDNLDTVFTTVFEPYRGNRYLESSEELQMEITDGTESASDAHRALKVTHKSGRIDYIFYSTNNSVTYKVSDGARELQFRGFAGVYTVNGEGVCIYKYVHDGDIIGEAVNAEVSINGVVKRFTTELSTENKITIIPETDLTDDELAELSGRYVFIDNGAATRSGTYKIENAVRSGNDIELDVGKTTTVRQYKDSSAPEKGYVYMLSEGQTARIPLTYSEDNSPKFEPVRDDIAVSAGSLLEMTLRAESPDVGTPTEIKYYAETFPRGAKIDESTGVLTWKPDSSQVGENHLAVTAKDSAGRMSTIHFVIKVLGSTTGGGGGGGTTPTDPTEPADPIDPTDPPNPTDPVTPPVTDDGFTDIGIYDWARDAIERLAEDGVIKGVTDKTFAPGANITRADFAILLVRAFGLTADGTDNFADVTPSDYFAAELAIARNAGLVGGIGDNKYAPRKSITREDMCVIVYRALTKLGYTLDIAGDNSDFVDFGDVSDYAREAVATLIKSGIIMGSNGKINPKANTTRAEVAVLLSRILDLTK